MDSFQSCYKDGTEPGTRDYRWFAGIPLVGRALLVLTYAAILESGFMPIATVVVILYHSSNSYCSALQTTPSQIC